MPPVSVKTIGNVGASSVTFIWPATEMLGSPFTIRLETEQFNGVIVNWPLTDPSPALFSEPPTSPVTEIVPPLGPLHGSPIKEIGKLQVSPVEVEVHPSSTYG
jgi:hypothetical protein